MAPRLCYCADGNLTHARLAVAAGWCYGVRLPAKGMLDDVPLAFADQDWRRPDRGRYMAELARHHPDTATVVDWEQDGQLPEVLDWAEEAAASVGTAVVVVVKVPGGAALLPRWIDGKEIWLGYSVPTSHGASSVGLWELAGWPVHLLGGSPQRQHEVYSYLRGIADVRQVDGNMAKKMATGRCLYWARATTRYGHWQPLGGFEGNGHEEALRRSLVNIREAWNEWIVAR